MARTIKVSKEKAEKERAREAGDKKLAVMKKLQEENQKRAQRIKDRKEKQLKIIREEKLRNRERYREECKLSRRSKSARRGGFVNPKVTFSKIG